MRAREAMRRAGDESDPGSAGETIPCELELKFELTEAQSRSLLEVPGQEGAPPSPVKAKKLHSVYFDTDDHALRRAATSLRVRRNGRKWVQTMKSGTGVAGGLSNPVEAEAEVASCEPDLAVLPKAAASHVVGLIGAKPLVPLFETRVERTTRVLRPGGAGLVEVAIDVGEIVCPAGTQPLREAELELTAGDAQILCDAATHLFSGEALRFGTETKAERGYRLAAGEPEPPLSPEKARAIVLSPDESCAAAFRKAAQSAAAQVLHNWRVTADSDDPEGPHQLRVGLRRLRSALRAFRPVIDTEPLRLLNAEARDVARQVGALRDLDVLGDEIVAPVAADLGGNAALEAVGHLLGTETARTRAELRVALTGPDWSAFQIRLTLLPQGAGWSQPDAVAAAQALGAAEFAAMTLDKTWRRAAKLAKRLDELDIEERHELRKRLKALRYTAEFFEPLYADDETRPFLKPLKRLLNLFGYLNDVAMAEKLIEICRRHTGASSELLGAAKAILAWHGARAEEAWSKVPSNWVRLKKAPKFWRAV